jgi:hypothetical protein
VDADTWIWAGLLNDCDDVLPGRRRSRAVLGLDGVGAIVVLWCVRRAFRHPRRL